MNLKPVFFTPSPAKEQQMKLLFGIFGKYAISAELLGGKSWANGLSLFQ